MVFYAYVTDSNIDPAFHVNQVELKFMDPKTADEWWCAVSEIPRLAEAIRRVNPRLYSNDTTKFDITTFFTSFDATIRAISQRFRQKLIITLVRINDEDEPDDDPPKPLAAMSKRPPQVAPVVERIGGINGNGNRNWLSIHSTTNSDVSWDPTDPRHVRVSQSNRTMVQVANQPHHPLPQAGNRNPGKTMQKAPLRYTTEDRLSLNLELPDSVSDPSSFFDFLNISANRNEAGIPANGLNGLVEGFGGLVINAVNVNGPSNRLGLKNHRIGPDGDGNGEVSHPPAPKGCLKPVNRIPVPEGPPSQPPNANGKGKAKACCFTTRPLKKNPPAVFKPQPQTVPAVAPPSGKGPHPVASGSTPGVDPHHGCGGFGHGGSPQPAWRGWGH